MRVHRLDCPACGASLVADAVDVEQGVATCCHCGGLLGLSQRRADAEEPRPRERSIPDGLRVDESEEELTIRHRSARMGGAALLLLAIGLLVGAGMLTASYLRRPGPTEQPHRATAGNEPLGYAIALAVAALPVGYVGLAHTLNATTIRTDGRTIEVHRGPIALDPAWSMDVQEIDRIYGAVHWSEGRGGPRHCVCFDDPQGQQHKLVDHLRDDRQAQYIAAALRQFLS